MRNVTIEQLTADIAHCLIWTLDDNSEYPHMHTVSTTVYGPLMRLHLDIERDGRLHVTTDSFDLYKYLRRDEAFPKMSCSIEPDPPKIAQQIRRRLFGPYRELLDELLKRKQANEAYQERKQQIAKNLASMLHTDYTDETPTSSDRYPHVRCYGKGSTRIEFIVNSDTSIQIKVDGANPEAAMHIAHTVQEWLRYGWTAANETDKLQAEEQEQQAAFFDAHPEVIHA